MAEYIERETAIAWFMPYAHAEESIDADVVISDIKGMKAADVSPARHGRWIETPRLCYGAKQYECSLCYSDTFWNKHSIYEKYPHCPNCGAIMDLEEAKNAKQP